MSAKMDRGGNNPSCKAHFQYLQNSVNYYRYSIMGNGESLELLIYRLHYVGIGSDHELVY